MFLRRLTLTNIRSIGSLSIGFEEQPGKSRPWTFLLGENGSGKSTVLRATALALAGSEALPEILGDLDWWIREGHDSASIELVLATANHDLRRVELKFVRGSGTLRFLTDNQNSLRELDDALRHAARNYFVVGYGVNRRMTPDSQSIAPNSSAYRTSRSQNVATLFSSNSALVSLEQWAIDLDYRRGDKGLDLVRSALNKLLPDVKFAGVDKEHRRLRFKTPDGTLPLELLSDGYQAMAAWCGDLLFRVTETFKNYKDPLNTRGLLLIDELDLHLHPVWQRQLVSFLRATLPRFQIIATTHSPLTVHQAGTEELFVLKRGASPDAGVVVEKFAGAPSKLTLSQLIQSPIFGLDTLDSPQVAEVRRNLRALKGLPVSDQKGRTATVKPASTAAGRAQQIRALEAKLEGVPDRERVPAYLRPTNLLLERIANELQGKRGDDTAASVQKAVRAVSRTKAQSSTGKLK